MSVFTRRPFRSYILTWRKPDLDVAKLSVASGLSGFGEIEATSAPPHFWTVTVTSPRNEPPRLKLPETVIVTCDDPLGRPANRGFRAFLSKQALISEIPLP